MARKMNSWALGKLAKIAAMVKPHCEDFHFCSLVEALAQQFIKDRKTALVQSGVENSTPVQPHLVEVSSACSTSNSLKRKKSLIKGDGKRSGKRAGREDDPTSHQHLRAQRWQKPQQGLGWFSSVPG